MAIRETKPIDRATRAPVSSALADRYDAVEVGASLREARILLRRSLPDVARELRIRYVYLLAIEEGRLGDLPGAAYQTGFLRTYGNYLGLDGAALAEDLKEARDASGEQDPLQVFSPIDEGHLPTRSILLLAALLAVAVYGVWYFLSNTEGDPVERVAALPDRLASLLDDEPVAVGEPAATDPARVEPLPEFTADPASQTSEPNAPDKNDDSGGETVRSASGAPESSTPPAESGNAPAAGPTAEAPPAEPVSEAPPAEPVARRSAAASLDATAPLAEADRPRVPASPVETEALPPVETAAATFPAPSPPVAEERSATPEPVAASRVVLHAATSSWIEIRTEDASLVHSGLLREGQSYSVPERPGLKMVTGNAGGLDITVDGEAIPRLGPPGAVIRDIDLDPDSLRGRAGR